MFPRRWCCTYTVETKHVHCIIDPAPSDYLTCPHSKYARQSAIAHEDTVTVGRVLRHSLHVFMRYFIDDCRDQRS